MITAVLARSRHPRWTQFLEGLLRNTLIRKAVVLHTGEPGSFPSRCEMLAVAGQFSGGAWNTILDRVATSYLLFFPDAAGVRPDLRAPERLVQTAEATGAGAVYADYAEIRGEAIREHPVNDYQEGSLRDGFDFGPLILLSTAAARRALRKYGKIPAYRWAGWYDLRLKISADRDFFHLPERLSTVDMEQAAAEGGKTGDGGHFAYVDPGNRALQEEMEESVTAHLKRIGAFLAPEFRDIPSFADVFPVEASVVIPVRNRVRTVADAVASALSQRTDFPFNVIVVDNHSTDGTTERLAGLAVRHPGLKHLVPGRRDLSIGGCWNEAIFSDLCGRYAVQLDSDDLYRGDDALQRLVDLLRRGDCAMAVGSYTLVDERLREIPPGLIDHREWTDANGRNNALRINGLGAPRAFDTSLLRRIGFPNCGYGEDYSVALRLSREYRIGRIYDSLYFCRRWEGNTDAALSVEQTNRHDHYKDRLRTLEIRARRKMNGAPSPFSVQRSEEAQGRKMSSAQKDRDFLRSRDADLRRRLFAVYGGEDEDRPLADLTAGLLERQKKSWTALAEGYAALEAAGVREIRGDNWMVKVQFNPRRIVSSGARLDPESIRKRPCFLCLSQLPPGQEAILYRDEFLIICNPAPIYPDHLTIVHRRHLPQALPERLGIFLRLAADFGPRMIVSYNGPRCGASAPDHLHFQAAPAGLLPVEAEVLEPRNRAGVRLRKEVSLWRTQGLERGILVIEGKGAMGVSSAFGAVISALGRFNPSEEEPMLNLFCTHTGDGWRLILFPRLKHRPDAYYREGDEKLLVSPGAADMGGMLITPIKKDFLAMDQKLIRGIFHEVALGDPAVDALFDLL
jgi:glycosyltransferase involved in cell wall biosynthesis